MIGSSISAEWGTGLFRSVRIALTALYVAASAMLVGGIYYFHQVAGIEQWGVIALGALLVTVSAGWVLAKIALDPLREHFDHLERLSKETLHELNLPVNTITANVEMLRKTLSDEKSLKRLNRIETAARMLKERYNELDYLIKKQIEREQIETFDLSELIEERLQFLRPLYPATEWSIAVAPRNVRCDRIGLGKVIDNLVENGIKYSPRNPRIEIVADEHLLRICDQGIGMDEIALMRIYERYYQNDSTMAGYGIGLDLVKRYCDRHGIALHVHSRPGEGTCVKLEFKKGEQ